MNARDETDTVAVVATLRETYEMLATRTSYRDAPLLALTPALLSERPPRPTRPERRVVVLASTLAAVLGLVILSSLVATWTAGPSQPVQSIPSVAGFYHRLARAVDRPGSIYRQVETLTSQQSGSVPGFTPQSESTTWLDSASGDGRTDGTSSFTPPVRGVQLVLEDQGYDVGENIDNGVNTGVSTRDSGTVPSCYGTPPALSLVLDCPSADPSLHARQVVTVATYRRVRTFVLSTETQPDSVYQLPTSSRLYVDAKTFLPLAKTTKQVGKVAMVDGTSSSLRTTTFRQRSTYHGRFVARSRVPRNFFTVSAATDWVRSV